MNANKIDMKFGEGRSDLSRDEMMSDILGGSFRSKENGMGDHFKHRDAISEMFDQEEKDAVFNSSVKKGGAMHAFNETFKNKPANYLKDRTSNKDFIAHPVP
jgi:hypothetical protein